MSIVLWPLDVSFSQKPIFPKIQFIYLTPWVTCLLYFGPWRPSFSQKSHFPKNSISIPDPLGSHVYWPLGPWRPTFSQKSRFHTWPLGSHVYWPLGPWRPTFSPKSRFHTWPLGVTCLLTIRPLATIIFPKSHFHAWPPLGSHVYWPLDPWRHHFNASGLFRQPLSF